MTDTLVVNVFIPSVNRQYDVRIPLDARIDEVAQLMAEAVSNLTRGEYASKQPTLCDKRGALLNPSYTPRTCNLHIGSQLILV